MIKYAVVRIDDIPSQFGCHIYAKQSSNPDTIRAYKEQIKKTYPKCQVAMVTVERAKAIQKDYRAWWDKVETIRFRKAYNEMIRKDHE